MKKWSEKRRLLFYKKVKRVNKCDIWIGQINPKGYGRCLKQTYGSSYAHRAVYINTFGPTELDIDHLCKNRSCVRIEHLEAVTHAENIMRRSTTLRTLTHCAKGHLLEGNLKYTKKGYERCHTCRKTYHNRANARRKEKLITNML